MQLQRLQSPLVAYLLALQRMKYMYAPVYNYFTDSVSVLFVCVFMSSSLSSSLLVIYIYILMFCFEFGRRCQISCARIVNTNSISASFVESWDLRTNLQVLLRYEFCHTAQLFKWWYIDVGHFVHGCVKCPLDYF